MSNHPEVMSFGGEESPLFKSIAFQRIKLDARYDESQLTLYPQEYSEFFQLARKMVGTIARENLSLHLEHYHTRFRWQWEHLNASLHKTSERNSQDQLRELMSLNSIDYDSASSFYEGRRPSSLAPLRDCSFIEDTPYVWPESFQKLDDEEFDRRVLLLKTSTHSYRLGHLFDLFCDSEISLIYLKRHPYASVNGLIDGWNFPGFHSFNTGLHLNHPGPLGDGFWKFDLYPHWCEDLNAPVPQIAHRQCLENHRAIQNFLSESGHKFLEIHYENLCATTQRSEALEKIWNFTGLREHELLPSLFRESVMPTSSAGPDRWRKNEQELRRLFNRSSEYADVLQELAYAK